MDSYLLVCIIFLSIISGVVITRFLTRWHIRTKMTRRVHRAALGEVHAREYLQRHGFTILGEQKTATPELRIDGVSSRFTLRADFLVSRHGRRAVVDAKSGVKAADPENPETRRRMFEYAHYYKVDDVYVYDDVNKILKKIEFSGTVDKSDQMKVAVAGFIAGTLFSLVIYFIVRMVSTAG